MTKFNYKELGLLCGLEIHQQLETETKLFCRCPAKLQGTRIPDYTIKRLMRPVLGEMGTFDKAMLTEYKKRMNVTYEGYNDVICTYEMDDTPPFSCNEEARRIALEIAMLCNANIIEEMHVCRKNYLDGSVPCGFQRTMILGTDGYIELKNGKKIGINILSLEEEAARRIKTENKTNYFRLDRLGIPLIEVTTDPDINHPDECRECAERIGLLLWSTKVKRVIGSIRQDINVSIKSGTRIEIKGVQKLSWIPILINHEISRQLGLVQIKEELDKRKIKSTDIPSKGQDITKLIRNNTGFIGKGIAKGKFLYGINFKDFKGIFGTELMENYRFGTEVSSKVKTIVGLKGLIHSDEDLSKYKFSNEDLKKIRKNLNSDPQNDSFLLILGSMKEIEKAIDIIIQRIKYALKGVPPETRKALETGNTEFLRELHGGARLYPDTDSNAIFNPPEEAELIRKNLPELPWITIENYSKRFKLEEKVIKKLIFNDKLGLFEKLIIIYPENPALIINTISEITTALRREGKIMDNIADSDFEDIFKELKRKEISKEAIEGLMIMKADNPYLSIQEIKQKLKIEKMSINQLKKIIETVVNDNLELLESKKMRAMGPLMGEVMKEVRGKIDGKIVSKELKTAIQNKIGVSK